MFVLTTVNILGGLRTPYSAQILADQPTKYLKLNESANPIIDYSLYNRGGSFSGTTSVFNHPREMHAETEEGLLFMPDAVVPHERLAFNHLLSQSSSFSIEFWFTRYGNITSTATQSLLGTTLSSPSYAWEIQLNPLNSTNRNLVLNFNFIRFSSFSWNIGYIYHIVLTFSGTQAQVYVNGVLRDTFTSSSVTTFIENINLSRADNTWYLGHGRTATQNSSTFLAHFATYDYVLASEQIARHYQLGYLWQPNNTNLIAWFKENINTTVLNVTEVNQWGNIAGTQTLHLDVGNTSERLIIGSDQVGFFLQGGSGKFLSTNFTTSTGFIPATSNFYVAFVAEVVTTPPSRDYTILTQYQVGVVGRLRIAVAAATGGYTYSFFVGGSPSFLVASTVFSGSARRIIVITRSGNTVTIYVNGALNVQSTHSTSFSIQQFRNVLAATDYSTSANFTLMDDFMTGIRLRELIIGSDITQINNITSYLAKEYQITI